MHGIPVAGLHTLKGIERTSISDHGLDKFTQIANRTDYDLSLLFLSIFHRELASLSTKDFRVIAKGMDRKKLAATGIVLPRA